MTTLREAALALKDDLILRANISEDKDPDGTSVVPCRLSVWYAFNAALAAPDGTEALMEKYAIETDDSFTECIERTIDGWKQRCLQAETRVAELEAQLAAHRRALTDARHLVSAFVTQVTGMPTGDAVKEFRRLTKEALGE